MPTDPAGDIYVPGRSRTHPLFAMTLFRPRLWVGIWAVLATVTTVLYLLPNVGPPGRAHLDKIAHLIAFGSVGFAALLGSTQWSKGVPLVVSFVLAMILEWLQSYVPGREYSVYDWTANLVGLGLGIAVAFGARAMAARLVARAA